MQMKLVSSGLQLQMADAQMSPELQFKKVMGQLYKRKGCSPT